MADDRTVDEAPPRTPLWKRTLLTLAVVSVVVGLALHVTGSGDAAGAPTTPGAAGALVAPGPAATPAADGTGDGLAAYAPFFLKGGFSFLVAYAIGTVVRLFLKAGLILLGVVALGLMALSWAGVMTVDWVDIEGQWDSLVMLASGRVDDAVAFVTGSLPSTAAALGGLVVGFRRG